MKKIFKLLFVFLGIILISGCGGSKVTKCELNSDQSASGYTLNSTYNIYSTGNVVKKVVTKETVTSENTTVLQYFEKTLKEQYETANSSYGGYKFDIKKTNNKVISSVSIDYSKLDMKKFVDNNTAMKSYVNKNNQLTLEGAKKLYETLGASCK